MVPMLTCGLVRSNFAFATVGPPQDSWGVQPLVSLVLPVWTGSGAWRDARSLAPGLLDDLLRDVPGNLGVGVELHAVVRPALRLGPQVANVAEHLGQRDLGPDHLDPARVLHGLDLPTAGVQDANYVALLGLGRTHLDRHDGRQQHRV